MELRQLRYLLALAETGHVGKAAELVHITQPGLSQQIRKLEDELGIRLIERSRSGIELSPAGHVLLPFARAVLRQIQDARAALTDLDRTIRGPVVIGTLQAINIGLLPKAIARLVDANNDVQVQAVELAAIEIESGLQEGRLDLGVGFLPVTQNPDGFSTEHLFQEHLVLVVRRQHVLANCEYLPIARLPELPLALLPARFQVRRILDEAARVAGIGPRVVVQMDNVHSLLELVRASDLGTILPAMAAPESSRTLCCIPLRDPVPSCAVGLVWRRHGFRSLASRALAAELRTLSSRYCSPETAATDNLP